MFKNLNAFMLKSYLTIPVVVYNIIISTIFFDSASHPRVRTCRIHLESQVWVQLAPTSKLFLHLWFVTFDIMIFLICEIS